MIRIVLIIFGVSFISSCSTNIPTNNINSTLLPPWQAGMSPVKVKSFKKFSPYKYFSNGDIETYNYTFEGKKENVQFFFKNGKLQKIGLYLYEGQNIRDARKVWLKLYNYLKRNYGEIEVPRPQIKSNKPVTPEILAITVAGYVHLGGNAQMAPIKQNKHRFVYSSFKKILIKDKELYTVVLFFNKPQK